MSAQPSQARGPGELLHAAAVLYFEQDATQAEVAARLGISQATVSRLVSEAKRRGMVQIKVLPPAPDEGSLGEEVAARLGLQRVYVFADTAPEVLGASMGPALGSALLDAELAAGDVVLISSGKMCYAAAHCDLPALHGVVVAPTVGGFAEPEAWYQTSEITREFAARVDGRPAFLYAPAVPSPWLRQSLLQDPAASRVVGLWDQARCAVLGVGAPPTSPRSLPHYARAHVRSLAGAVGDVCSRFYDADGQEVAFPGSESMLSTPLETLRRVPVTIAVARGQEKLLGIRAGAAAGFFNRLVTDTSTAELLLR
ncbi:sugar-binding transcriptional regulator [Quadrisphaera oryzae]|uniref:sugar-binding transcriptional regulator n=1 Tax=Quadrisphaera TaxID=317661 RepID=UPI0016473BFA|nr:sugar-binding domain-containing protein [Quadrisphaera sp. RL12-1S]MBC3760631.1 MarR family transcriptional regulator [Quadrisphaera sp. RL12-1S]